MYIGSDINFISRDRLSDMIGDDLADRVIERRQVSTINRLDEILSIEDIDQTTLRTLQDARVDTGPSLGSAVAFPTPTFLDEIGIINRTNDVGLARPGMAELMFGLSRVFRGMGMLMNNGDNDDDDTTASAPLTRAPGTISIPETDCNKTTMALDHHGELSIPVQTKLPKYCLVVWILTNGENREVGNGGSPLGAKSTARSDDVGLVGLRMPTQESVNQIAKDVTAANEIFKQCDFVFQLCQVHVLDTTVAMTIGDSPQTLASAMYDAGGTIFGSQKLKPSFNPLFTLYDVLLNRLPGQFNPNCAHIFYTNQVQNSPDSKDTKERKTKGLGAPAIENKLVKNPQYTPVGIIEGHDAAVGTIMAHELMHGLGISEHAEESTAKDVKDDKDNVMKELNGGSSIQPSQCNRIKQFIKTNNLQQGCGKTG